MYCGFLRDDENVALGHILYDPRQISGTADFRRTARHT
jgi:hypothetical protein